MNIRIGKMYQIYISKFQDWMQVYKNQEKKNHAY